MTPTDSAALAGLHNAIVALINRFELDTGRTIRRIAITETETTRMDDTERQFRRSLEIVLEPERGRIT